MNRFFILSLVGLSFVTRLPAAETPPNFVVILAEAQGWASMSAPQDDRHPEASRSDFIRTPTLDALAERGARFSDFYAASPRCTPTRAALVTGRNPAALKMTFVNEGKKDGLVQPGDRVIQPTCITELPAGIATLATLLKQQGYATAHFGKWHLGRANPREHGYDENDGANSNGGPDEVEDPNPKQCYAIAEQGMAFMDRQVKARRPFLLQLSQYPGRGPVTAREDTLEAVRRRLGTRMDFQRIGLAAGNEEIDKSLGLVVEKLRALGALENTYIIYTADHGAQGNKANGVLNQGKGSVWEGGLRVPLLISGPHIPPRLFCHAPASTMDVLPTILELARCSLPVPGLEGSSLVPLLRGAQELRRSQDSLVIHFPHYDKDPLGPASALYWQHWKLIRFYETDQRLLFDLSGDIEERKDQAKEQPQIAAQLDHRLTTYLNQVHADLPRPNPNYDPEGARSGDRRGGQGPGKKGNPKAQ
ncbi:Arylsulfatase A [Prosthecobacter debontii]|uniref:Arylsulfatase A n=1 Tax=Prosthecobacter debontii TaxID=48467 RepID=A0A1T4XLE4_9BACT|nr:sulfatase-like hydrolase/transferase [Prosthecobacter debontii]SKA89891.1 Arylsulfatase A [Prosthecobacter debontii]